MNSHGYPNKASVPKPVTVAEPSVVTEQTLSPNAPPSDEAETSVKES